MRKARIVISNKLSQHRPCGAGPPFRCLFLCFNAYASTKSITSTPAAAAGRYERGSKINKMSHVLDLRHVVESLSALM